MYTVADFLAMLGDDARREPLEEALRRVVRPGDRVIDLGCGVGYFAVLAALSGAAHVDAIDVNPAVSLARRLAEANGVADRITVHHADARQVTLAAPADVLFSDLRGALPLHGEHLDVLADVRQRLLRPGARHVWERDRLCVALARGTKHWQHVNVDDALSCDVRVIRAVSATAPYTAALSTESLRSAGECFAVIDYATVNSSDVAGDVVLRVEGDGPVEALAIWFDADLQPGVGFSNAPGTTVHVYRQLLLPVVPALTVRDGDAVRVQVSAHQTPSGYVWEWGGKVAGRDAGFTANSLLSLAVQGSVLERLGRGDRVRSTGDEGEASDA